MPKANTSKENLKQESVTLEEIAVKTPKINYSVDEKKKRPQYSGKEKAVSQIEVEEKSPNEVLIEEKEEPGVIVENSQEASEEKVPSTQEKDEVSSKESPKIEVNKEEKREKYGSFVLDDMKSSDGGDKADKKLFLLGVSVFAATVILCGGAFFLFLRPPAPQKEVVVEVKTTPTPTPIAPTLKREEWSIEILNGSGISGVAKKTADKLEALGYVIESTGNAPKRYIKTEIFISSGKTVSDINLFLADMKKEFGVGTSSGDLSDSTADIQIIVGTDNSE